MRVLALCIGTPHLPSVQGSCWLHLQSIQTNCSTLTPPLLPCSQVMSPLPLLPCLSPKPYCQRNTQRNLFTNRFRALSVKNPVVALLLSESTRSYRPNTHGLQDLNPSPSPYCSAAFPWLLADHPPTSPTPQSLYAASLSGVLNSSCNSLGSSLKCHLCKKSNANNLI